MLQTLCFKDPLLVLAPLTENPRCDPWCVRMFVEQVLNLLALMVASYLAYDHD